MIHRGSLDHWLDYFNIHIPQRHNASADAMATAEIALILLNRAQRIGLTTFDELAQRAGAGSAPQGGIQFDLNLATRPRPFGPR